MFYRAESRQEALEAMNARMQRRWMISAARGVFELCDNDENGGCSLSEIVETAKNVGKPAFFFISDMQTGEITSEVNIVRRTMGSTRRAEAAIKMCDTNESGGCTIDEIG